MNAVQFWSKVDIHKPDECWLWTGSITRAGYGRIWFQHTRTTTHRVAWELTHGPIPEGMHICHSCDTPPCVNPDHLWLGTNLDNMHDKSIKGRVKRLRGTANGRARLQEAEVRSIRRMYSSGHYTQSRLGRIYDVSESQITHILSGKNWKHVR